MPLTLLTGRANTGKTGRLYEVVRASARAGEVPVVLLPSQPDVTRARNELLGRDGLVTVRVEQMDRYLAQLWSLHGDGRTIVSPTQRAALVARAIAATGIDKETDYGSKPGFAALIEQLANVSDRAPGKASVSGAEAIVDVLEAYRSALAAGGLIGLVEATHVLSSRVRREWFDGPLVANRFDDLTGAQEAFILAAVDAGVSVHLALTGGGGAPVFAATRELVERLSSVADEVVERPAAEPTSDEFDELRMLEQGLLGEMPRVAATGAVRLSAAFGEDSEAERICAEIQRMHVEGIEFGQIAVVFRAVEKHERSLRRAMREAGIPALFDVRPSFASTGFGHALMTLLEFSRSGERSVLVAFLGTAFSGVDSESSAALDALWRTTKPKTRRAFVQDLARVGDETKRLVRRAVKLADTGVNATNAGEWKRTAGELLAGAYGNDAPLLDATGARDAAAHRAFCMIIDDLSALEATEDSRVSLRSVLEGARISVREGAEGDQVQVMDAHRVRGRRFEGVIIGGLTSGEFPRRARESVLVRGALGGALERAGVTLPREERAEADRLLFYLAATRARRTLILSRQIADSDGRPLRDSILLEELLDLYRDDEGRLDPGLPQSTLAFADLAVHEAAPSLLRRALRAAALSGGAHIAPEVLRARERLAPPDEALSEETVLQTLGARAVFSVTELETYLRCPYSWYYDRLVRPRPLEEDSEPLVRGSLVHDALEAVYSGMAEALGAARVTPANVETAVEYAASVASRVAGEELEERRLRDEMLRRDVVDLVTRLVRRDARHLPGFEPYALEWSFGLDDDPEEFDGFALRGRIDRIDRGPAGYVVTDYKTGSATRAGRFIEDGVLQAPLYAEVVRRRLGGPIAGSFYRSLTARKPTDLNRGMYDARLLDPGPELCANDAKTEIEELVASAIDRAREAARGIRNGSIPRRPLGKTACRYCAAAAWCEAALR